MRVGSTKVMAEAIFHDPLVDFVLNRWLVLHVGEREVEDDCGSIQKESRNLCYPWH